MRKIHPVRRYSAFVVNLNLTEYSSQRCLCSLYFSMKHVFFLLLFLGLMLGILYFFIYHQLFVTKLTLFTSPWISCPTKRLYLHNYLVSKSANHIKINIRIGFKHLHLHILYACNNMYVICYVLYNFIYIIH